MVPLLRRGLFICCAVVGLVICLTFQAEAYGELTEPDRHVAAGGQLMFARPHDFGLAVHPDQVLVRSVIPPCSEGFEYCLYYYGDKFQGTNLKSAGIRINRRQDLSGSAACLLTPPAGYAEFEPVVHAGDGYMVSVFAPLQEAAMGHYAVGKLFRLFIGGAELEQFACFEIEVRIGMSQVSHYPEGTIRALTGKEREALERRLAAALRDSRLVDRPNLVLFEFSDEEPADASVSH